MSKIYGVVISSYDEELQRQVKTVLKTFRDIKKAEHYRDELIAEEKEVRHMSAKCQNCGAYNYNCPYYTENEYGDEACGNYEYYVYHEDNFYGIIDIELEE